MRHLRFTSLLVSIAFTLNCPLYGQRVAPDKRVSLAGGRVSFEPPPGFKPWSQEQVAVKYPRVNPPQFVFANETGSVSVAVTFSSSSVAPENLPQLREVTGGALVRMIPGLKWLTREYVELDGRRWVHLEATSHAIDTDIHNHMYITSFDGKGLIFGFNSTVKNYPLAKAALEKSVRSIKIAE